MDYKKLKKSELISELEKLGQRLKDTNAQLEIVQENIGITPLDNFSAYQIYSEISRRISEGSTLSDFVASKDAAEFVKNADDITVHFLYDDFEKLGSEIGERYLFDLGFSKEALGEAFIDSDGKPFDLVNALSADELRRALCDIVGTSYHTDKKDLVNQILDMI